MTVPPAIPSDEVPPIQINEDILDPTDEFQCSWNTEVTDFSDFSFLDPLPLQPLASTDLELI